MVPSEFSLILKTHLHHMAFLCGGRLVIVQILFLISAVYSTFIASVHLGLDSDCFADVGSASVRYTLGLRFPVRGLVTIVCLG